MPGLPTGKQGAVSPWQPLPSIPNCARPAAAFPGAPMQPGALGHRGLVHAHRNLGGLINPSSQGTCCSRAEGNPSGYICKCPGRRTSSCLQSQCCRPHRTQSRGTTEQQGGMRGAATTFAVLGKPGEGLQWARLMGSSDDPHHTRAEQAPAGSRAGSRGGSSDLRGGRRGVRGQSPGTLCVQLLGCFL